ncbi:MAG: hypothetical protein NZ761_08670, partial [Dehalococcoidia bacterium]|nr:hypothetical protein [Dehalococcoidia bacterium]
GVREIVRLGIRAGEWVYYDAGAQQAYDRASELDPTVRIAEDAFVYTPEAAARENLPLVRPRPPQPVPTVERCPVCGEPTASCRCSIEIAPPRVTEEAIASVGPLSQAIARLCDEMRDRGLTGVRDLALELETGAGNEARAFALWLDRLLVDRGPGLHLVHELRVTLAQGGELEVRFVGPAEQYLRHRSTFDGMLKGASHLSASFRLQLGEFAAGDLERLSPLADDPLAAEFGRVQLTGRGERGEQERAG